MDGSDEVIVEQVGDEGNNKKKQTNKTFQPAKSNKQLLQRPHLTVDSIILLCQQCQSNIYKHQLTKNHLACKQFWSFSLPQAILVLMSGILAFFVATPFVEGEREAGLAIFTGILSVLVVFNKTIESYFNYNMRASMHYNTCCDLRDLRDDLEIMRIKTKTLADNHTDGDEDMDMNMNTDMDDDDITAIKVEKPSESKNENKNKSDKNNDNNGNEESFNSIQSRYSQCLQACKSTIPLGIDEAYRMMDSQLDLKNTVLANEYFKTKGFGDDWHIKVWFASYNRLTAEITSYKFWPMCIPDSASMVKKTMRNVKKIVQEGDDFWNDDNSV